MGGCAYPLVGSGETGLQVTWSLLPRGRIRDIQVGRFRITLDRGGRPVWPDAEERSNRARNGASGGHLLEWLGREDLNPQYPSAGLWCRAGLRMQSLERPGALVYRDSCLLLETAAGALASYHHPRDRDKSRARNADGVPASGSIDPVGVRRGRKTGSLPRMVSSVRARRRNDVGNDSCARVHHARRCDRSA
jgi:hypothetical protein